MEQLDQALRLGLDVAGVLALGGLFGRRDGALKVTGQLLVDDLAVLLELTLRLVRTCLGVVAGLGQRAQALVVVGVRLGVRDHRADLGIRQAAGGLDTDLLLVAAPQILGRHVDDAVGVDVERDLDLRNAPRRRWDADQLELAECLVVARHLPLALEHVDLDLGLRIFGRREDLALAGRDGRVALDESREHTALGLDAERQRRDVEQQDVLDLTRQHTCLDGRADGDDLIRVDALVGLFAGQLLDPLLHRGHARHATDQDDVVDRPVLAGVGDGLLGGSDEPIQQIGDELLELGPRQRQVQMLGAGRIRRHERQVDLGDGGGRQLDLGLLGRLVQALQRHLVDGQIDALLTLELRAHPVDDRLVEVVATQVVVTGGGLDFEHPVADLEHGHVERATAQVEDQDRLVGALVQAVRQGGCGRLVDDPLDIEAGDLAGVARGLPLRVVEVRGHRDDRFGDRLAQERLGVGLELLQDHGADLRRRVLLVAHVNARVSVGATNDVVGNDLHLFVHLGELASHEPLDREHGVLGVGHGLPFGHGANKALTRLCEPDDRWGRPPTLGVGKDFRLTAGEDRDTRVGGAQVDADRLTHGSFLLRRVPRHAVVLLLYAV